MKSPTLANAILDRLCHNAYRIVLKGESRRKTRNKTTEITSGPPHSGEKGEEAT
jgi:hypothetical protein